MISNVPFLLPSQLSRAHVKQANGPFALIHGLIVLVDTTTFTLPTTVSPRANAEIAQVRGKAQQEQVAYQASLRKEQLKVDALERTLEQKVTCSEWHCNAACVG